MTWLRVPRVLREAGVTWPEWVRGSFALWWAGLRPRLSPDRCTWCGRRWGRHDDKCLPF